MKNIINYLSEGLKIGKNYKRNKYNYQPKDKKELNKIVKQLIEERGKNADLNDIDTSEITDMSHLFSYAWATQFNGDISRWNTSHVTDMSSMFESSEFNGNISNWDVSNVKDMSLMFTETDFNQDISQWNVSGDTHIYKMFENCPLEKNKSKWPKY